MKALTVRQPFAWAIAGGFKDIENRSWAPRLQQDEYIAIHAAAARPDAGDVAWVEKLIRRRASIPEEFERGAVIAVARVAKVVSSSRSPWFSGPLGWVFEDVSPVREPIQCKG